MIIILLDFCKKFDVGGGFAVGLILLPYVFWPMLGFGSARYIGGTGRAGRRRTAEEEEDEGGAGRSRRRRTAEEEDER